jgi:phosphoglycolate phosphatase
MFREMSRIVNKLLEYTHFSLDCDEKMNITTGPMKNTSTAAFIFDLDGTVVNPGTAIPRCINYALKKQGMKTVPIERLKRYIGFSLESIFAELTGKSDRRFIKGCIDAYRERFHKEGIAEHRLYPGIVGLLEAVAEKGCLHACSIKPKVSAEMVLDHLGIKHLFKSVHGSDLKNKTAAKPDLFKNLIKKEKIKTPVVVGDRGVDIEAAKKCKLQAIGVTYGYGTKDELKTAGADYVAETVGELRQCLLTS